ncbi:MAG: hypothetical protein HND48_26820 [Chloroflexi bacterium]|nr:hypothetical protein [Chloroflexota bacterium]
MRAAVQTHRFDLIAALDDALTVSGVKLADGDVLAVSSKYTAISEGRIVDLADVVPSGGCRARRGPIQHEPQDGAARAGERRARLWRYSAGFLLTHVHGIISPNAGLDRSNIPQRAGRPVPG